MPSNSDSNEKHPKSCMSYKAMQCLNEMRMTNILCDATITLDDKVFTVHRAVLCANSDYFLYL